MHPLSISVDNHACCASQGLARVIFYANGRTSVESTRARKGARDLNVSTCGINAPLTQDLCRDREEEVEVSCGGTLLNICDVHGAYRILSGSVFICPQGRGSNSVANNGLNRGNSMENNAVQTEGRGCLGAVRFYMYLRRPSRVEQGTFQRRRANLLLYKDRDRRGDLYDHHDPIVRQDINTIRPNRFHCRQLVLGSVTRDSL